MSVGIAIITHSAKRHLEQCLKPLIASPLKPKILVVNSSSHDGTIEEAKELGAEVLVVPRNTFNHGSTRELARKTLNTDIAVMMTPDAYPLNHTMVERLVAPILTNEASVSYARQIPHDGAGFFESFPRHFNYPLESHIRTLADKQKYGSYIFFCSDSCAAYDQRALDSIGGFDQVLLGEDTIAVAKLLQRGHKIAYVADAIVKHSHRYSMMQEFRRHFDTGLARKEAYELLGSDTKRGQDYVKAMMKTLIKEQPELIPYATLQSLVKWIGYKTGQLSLKAPHFVKKMLSSQDFYW